MHLLNLPDEVWLHIISFLALRDRKNLRLVNKHFYQLTYDTTVIKNDVLVVGTTRELDKQSIRRKAYALKIKNTHLETCSPFWTECGPYVKSLELYLVNLTDPFLLEILSSVPNLEYLVLSSYDENDKTKVPGTVQSAGCLSFKGIELPKLLSIDLYHLQASLAGRNLHELIEKSPKLKRFSFEWMINQPEDVDFLTNCLEAHRANLKELDLSYSKLDDAMLTRIVSTIGNQLTGFYLRKCPNLTDISLKAIARRFPGLKEIDISNTCFTHEDIQTFLQSFENLTHISLKQTKLQGIGDCLDKSHKKLKAVELSDCRQWKSKDSLIVLSPLPSLADLRIDYLRIDDEAFTSILPFIPNIIFLVLNGNRKITEKSLNIMSEKCKKIRSISLQDTRVGQLPWANQLKGLVHLDLYGCTKVTKDSVRQLSLLELQTLDLSGTQVDTDCFDALLKNCPSLLHVYADYGLDYSASRDAPKFHYGMSRFALDSIFDN